MQDTVEFRALNTSETRHLRWRQWATRLGWILAMFIPAWIAGSRLLMGATGPHALIYAITLAPFLLVLAVFTLLIPAFRGQRFPSGRACAWLWMSYGFGLILGLMLPDAGPGPTAVVSLWWGESWEGAASALSNPAAIVMGMCVIFAAVFSFLDSRPGGPRRTTDEDDYQGSGFYPVLDQH